jgi:hypothetical protein
MQEKGYHLEEEVIVLERGLTELDLFVKKFLDILKKHLGYLIVSGYVSISTGRTRGTEDVDVIVPISDEKKFILLFNDLKENGFWCYQGEKPDEIHKTYITQSLGIRFAKEGEFFPNMEFISFGEKKMAKSYEYSHPQEIRIGDFNFKIPPLEFEILYKELVLKSRKDLDDAKHLRSFFSEILDKKKFDECRKVILSDLK